MYRFGRALVLGAMAAPLVAQAQTPAQAVGYVTGVLASDVDPNHKVPALNGVSGAGISNVDLGFPYAVLTHGQPYVVSIVAQNGTFNGSCKSSYAITQIQSGKLVKLLGSAIKTYSCEPGTVWIWVIQTPNVPNAVGAAKLIGSVKYGSTVVSLSVPIYIQ